MKSITDEMHNHHTMFQGAGTYMPRVGTKAIQVQQDLEKYLSLKGKDAAYKDWLYKLNRNDKLPRGKFFKGKKAGKPVVIMDEFHMAFRQSSNPFPYQPTGNFDANSLVTKS